MICFEEEQFDEENVLRLMTMLPVYSTFALVGSSVDHAHLGSLSCRHIMIPLQSSTQATVSRDYIISVF